MRVIVCGSRSWTGIGAETRINDILNRVQHLCEALGEELTIVHGACPNGADAIADRWALRREGAVRLHTYPANWARYPRSAGVLRNQDMALGGADMCLAFLRDNSRGTLNMIDTARGHKIPTYIIPWEVTGDDDDNEPPPAKPWRPIQDPVLVQLHDERLYGEAA